MTLAPAYVAARFVHRILGFLEHWYVGSFRVVGSWTLALFGRLDRSFALIVTFKHFFQPLYQDRTFIGYVLGVIFRSVRVVVAVTVYIIVFFLITLAYLVWLLVIPFIIYEILKNFAYWKNV